VQRAGGRVERPRVDTHLTALASSDGSEFGEANVVADAETDAGELYTGQSEQTQAAEFVSANDEPVSK
jgi:hypothetical protein